MGTEKDYATLQICPDCYKSVPRDNRLRSFEETKTLIKQIKSSKFVVSAFSLPISPDDILSDKSKEKHMNTATVPTTTVTAPVKPADNLPKHHPVSVSKIKVGDMMAFSHYVKIQKIGKDIHGRDELVVDNLDNGAKSISIAGSELIESATSADQYAEEVLLSRTAVINILLRQFNRPITVAWVKKDGSDRVLRGRLVDVEESNTGYSSAEDLDLPNVTTTPGKRPDRLRQIDHRTLKYVIANGVKYTVK